MPDDLDDNIRAAMKTLDDEVPSGYFEALPNRTLARLEGSMQHGSSGTTDTRDNVAPPPTLTAEPAATPAAPVERDEDSGLHDIRNLAQSTKQRLSSRRITAQPEVDDVLASSSGSFKNIALPQPAKMVSLPALDELPSKAEVVAAEKAAKKAAKEAAKEAKVEAVKVEAAAPAIAAAQPAVETPAPTRKAFALPSQQRRSNKGLFAVLGIGLAAAAGAVIYVQTSRSADQAAPVAAAEQSAPPPETVAAAAPAAGSAVITATEIPTPPPPVEPAVDAAEAAAATGAAQIAADDAEADDKAETRHHKAKGTKQKVEKEATKVEEKKAPDKTKTEKTEKTDKAAKGSDSGEQEPSFDALLKEAGVTEKKDTKPKLAKKKLTGSDFKHAMDGVEGKAKACYKGTVGTVMVHMTIEPDGSIKKLTVGGAFAGKPEAACVQAAMKSATFPPWDGAPQSFSYAVMLSD
jgi:hypothetical protein